MNAERLLNSILYTLIAVFVLLLLVVGGFAIRYHNDHNKATIVHGNMHNFCRYHDLYVDNPDTILVTIYENGNSRYIIRCVSDTMISVTIPKIF